jgi:hypothetical protein
MTRERTSAGRIENPNRDFPFSPAETGALSVETSREKARFAFASVGQKATRATRSRRACRVMPAVGRATPATAPTSPTPRSPAPAVKAKGNFKLAESRARAKRLQKFEEETLR